MGFVSDLRTLHRRTEQIRQGYDPVATAQSGLVSMRAARRSMEAAARARSSSSAREAGVETSTRWTTTGDSSCGSTPRSVSRCSASCCE